MGESLGSGHPSTIPRTITTPNRYHHKAPVTDELEESTRYIIHRVVFT